jgi:ribosomal protein S18 acetylase RimI-like enzyme
MSGASDEALDPVFEQLARIFVELGRVLQVPGGVMGSRPGLWYGAIGGPIAGFNRLVVTRMDAATVEADLDAALEALARFPILSAWIPPGAAPPDLGERLGRRGFVADDDLVPAMAADLDGLPSIEPASGVTWARVDTADGIPDLLDVLCAGFEVPDSLRPMFERALAGVASAPRHVASYLVSLDGRPASTAMAAVIDDVAGIYNVATIPEARGRGLGALATHLAMRRGGELGAKMAVLESSDMAYSLYERLGFREVGRYRVLVRRREGAI